MRWLVDGVDAYGIRRYVGCTAGPAEDGIALDV